jgi:hypothetical protein
VNGVFVGRDAEIRASLELLDRTGSHGAVLDVVGVHGIGKSVFLDRLAELARAHPDVVVLTDDMKRWGLGEGFTDDLGATATSAVLWETFNRSRQLMKRFAEQHREFDAFRAACLLHGKLTDDYLASNDIALGRRAQVETVQITSSVHLSEESTKQRIREAQAAVDDAFVDAWSEFTRRRRVLVTADSFEVVADDEMGQWLVRTARRLPRTLVVVARTPAERHVWTYADDLQLVSLPNLSVPEVAGYLAQRLDHERLQPGVVEVVHGFTDGHPGGVTLVGDLLDELGPGTVDARALRRTLARLPADPPQRWAELVRLILETIREPELLNAMEAASITTTFDAPLLRKLTRAESAEPGGRVSRWIGRLRGLRLLQQVPTLAGEPSDRFRVHEFIRLAVAEVLRTVDPEEWTRLHTAAAEHFFEQLQHWESDPYATFGAWYRFEDPDWQEAKRDWLRHAGMVDGHQRAMTRARFTLVFLEAFWWWGYYVPFPFCRQLLEEWGRAAAGWNRSRVGERAGRGDEEDRDDKLLEALTFLLNTYPVGERVIGPEEWDELRNRLLLVRRLCGLDRASVRGASSEERHDLDRARAMITLFLAHTRRFRDPHDPQAERYYAEASGAFQALEDDWNTAWMWYERGDLALERGDLPLACARIGEAAHVVRAMGAGADPWDHELLSNLHRVRADVHWARGELAEAALAYGRAVAHAYWCQGDPNPPDEYTQQFYVEITTRAAQRVAALVPDPAAANRFLAGLRNGLPGGYAAPVSDPLDADVSALRERLFLRGPAAGELRYADSAFMSEWAVVHEDGDGTVEGIDALEG